MKYYDFFSPYLADLKSSPAQQKVICPFHGDTDPSLSINLETGKFFCHGCDKKGDIYEWVMHWEHISFKEAKRKILGDARIDTLSEAEVAEAHKLLLDRPRLLEAVAHARGWILPILIKFQIGYNEVSKRIYIPIRDEHGKLKNIRKYDMFRKNKNNKFIGVKGHNTPYFFPMENLVNKENKFIMLMAGEPDTILACQNRMIAGTFTSGEGSYNRDLLPYFKDKLVYICYDIDVAGQRGIRTVGKALSKYASEIKEIDLPFERG